MERECNGLNVTGISIDSPRRWDYEVGGRVSAYSYPHLNIIGHSIERFHGFAARSSRRELTKNHFDDLLKDAEHRPRRRSVFDNVT